MRTIRISEEVWQEIAKRGTFGQTVDDVLRKVFRINDPSKETLIPIRKIRNRIAKIPMSPRIEKGYLSVEFRGGSSNKWLLPSNKGDAVANSLVRKQAVKFAEENGATDGQVHAVIKKMTDNGYFTRKKI